MDIAAAELCSFRGVTRTANGLNKWRARITLVNGEGAKEEVPLGVYATRLEAAQAYDKYTLSSSKGRAVTNFDEHGMWVKDPAYVPRPSGTTTVVWRTGRWYAKGLKDYFHRLEDAKAAVAAAVSKNNKRKRGRSSSRGGGDGEDSRGGPPPGVEPVLDADLL